MEHRVASQNSKKNELSESIAAGLTLGNALDNETGMPLVVELASAGTSGKTVVFCSLSRLYLPKALIFAASLKKFHPDWEYHLLINDSWSHDLDGIFKNVDKFVQINRLGIDGFHSWAFSMDAEEICCASRPFYFKALLDAGYEKVFFFDPDIEVFHELDYLSDLLEQHDVILTPHTDKPAISDAEIFYTEMSVLAHGVFNLGFIGARNTKNGNDVIGFWRHRLTRYSLKEHARGLWTDQKWFNLVPIYFEGVHIIRHPGCNTASWNISHREITKQRGRYYAAGEPLLFFHFSGYDKGIPRRMYQLLRGYNSCLEELFESYTSKHEISAHSTPVSVPRWSFGFFDNDEPVPFAARRFYRSTLDNRSVYRQPFFEDSDPSFYKYMNYMGLDYIVGEYDPPGKLRRHF